MIVREGIARRVEIKRHAHQILCKGSDGESSSFVARWVVDATGRSGVLAKQLGLRKRKEEQRSSFWFRLKDFDPSIIDNLDPRNVNDSFPHRLATHHFFGKNCWNWVIPLREEGKASLMSIGTVYRSDLGAGEVRNMEEFLAYADKEHPVLAELVRSGTVLDTNVYRNYMYDAKQVYSDEGWFLVGDAANSVDPLYSMGLAITSVQIKQVAAMVGKDLVGELTQEFAENLDYCHRSVFAMIQDNITDFYKCMHDPLQAHLHVHFDTAAYFFFLLPHWMKDYASDLHGSRWLGFCMNVGKKHIRSLQELFASASARKGKIKSRELFNFYEDATNWDGGRFSESDLQRFLSSLAISAGAMRLQYLVAARGKRFWYHLPIATLAVMFGCGIRFMPQGKTITRVRRGITSVFTAPFRALRSSKTAPQLATANPATEQF